jgi:hypothetical protein
MNCKHMGEHLSVLGQFKIVMIFTTLEKSFEAWDISFLQLGNPQDIHHLYSKRTFTNSSTFGVIRPAFTASAN